MFSGKTPCDGLKTAACCGSGQKAGAVCIPAESALQMSVYSYIVA